MPFFHAWRHADAIYVLNDAVKRKEWCSEKKESQMIDFLLSNKN